MKRPILRVGERYATLENKPVRIYCTDAGGPYPVHGAIWSDFFERWRIMRWTPRGRASRSHPGHLDSIFIDGCDLK